MIPFVKEFDFAYGRPDRLSDLIVRVVAENPGPFTYTGSGTYLIGDAKGVAVIDPGPALDPHVDAICAAAPGPITDILVTHSHRDHCGGTDALVARTGATVHAMPVRRQASAPDAPKHAPALDEGVDESFAPTAHLSHEDIVRGPSFTLRALHTPGHMAEHLCFHLEEEDVLFTGDHIMGWATTVIAPPDGDMEDYLRSLDYLLTVPHRRYLPTHGAPIDDPLPFVEAVKAHRLARDEAILAAALQAPRNALEIVDEVYEGLVPALRPAAALNVRAHLTRHIRLGTIHLDGEIYRKV